MTKLPEAPWSKAHPYPLPPPYVSLSKRIENACARALEKLKDV